MMGIICPFLVGIEFNNLARVPGPSPSDAPVARERDGCHKIHTVVLLFSGSIVTFMYFLLLLLYFPLECNKCNARTRFLIKLAWGVFGQKLILHTMPYESDLRNKPNF